MKRENLIALTVIFVLVRGSACLFAEDQNAPRGDNRPRVIVLTDITNEPDDEQSMVRFLVYSNEYDVEGLIATTSVWLRDRVRPEKIIERIEAFGQVRENLLKHASGFPTPGQLLKVTCAGRAEFGMQGVGADKSSAGSRHIISVVDRDDERPVWISVWGGANCLAQALWDVKRSRSQEQLDAFVAKLRVYSISDQDDSGRWLRINFPNLYYIVSPSSIGYREYYKATWTGISGDRRYRNGPMHQFHLVDNPWLEEHVINDHGPLGALYPKLEYIMEGDTPSFLGLVNNGLGSHLSPSFGGWSGRYVLYESYGETRPIWTNVEPAQDTVTADDGKTYTSAQATIWRWREAFQNDFAARMDWCVADSFEKANHNPTPVVDGDRTKNVLRRRAKPGQRFSLNAIGTQDPDNDALTYRWWHYSEAEADDQELTVKIEKDDQPEASFAIPKVTQPVKLHIILEVKDNGQPPLFSYRRLILDVN
jgi:hypothetical protein